MNNTPIMRPAVIAKAMLGVAGFVCAFVFVSVVLRRPLQEFSSALFSIVGPGALPGGFFLISAFLLPLPDDVLSGLALLNGMKVWVVASLAILGSVTGGVLAFHLGRLLRHTNASDTLLRRHRAAAEALIEHYGAAGLAVAALTPIPDSPICWICGGLGLTFRQFLPVYVVCRSVRITYAVWLMHIGLSATAQ